VLWSGIAEADVGHAGVPAASVVDAVVEETKAAECGDGDGVWDINVGLRLPMLSSPRSDDRLAASVLA
jgi:hypothetical protein